MADSFCPALVTRPCAGRRPATSESLSASATLRLCGNVIGVIGVLSTVGWALAAERQASDGRIKMSFILTARRGGELQVNAWNWRPTLALLLNEDLIDGERHELLGAHGCGAGVDEELAGRIAEAIERKLKSADMKAGMRMRAKTHKTFHEDSLLLAVQDGCADARRRGVERHRREVASNACDH